MNSLKINAISVYLLDNCVYSCPQCTLLNKKPDIKAVLKNLVEFLKRYKTYLTKKDINDYHSIFFALEASDLLTSNRDFIYSSSFKLLLNYLSILCPESLFNIVNLGIIRNEDITRKFQKDILYLNSLIGGFNNIVMTLNSPVLKEAVVVSDKLAIRQAVLSYQDMNKTYNELSKKYSQSRDNTYHEIDIAINLYKNDCYYEDNKKTKDTIEYINNILKNPNLGYYDYKYRHNNYRISLKNDKIYVTHDMYHPAKITTCVEVENSLEEAIDKWNSIYGKEVQHTLSIFRNK